MSFDPKPFVDHIRKANSSELRVIRDRADRAKREARRLAELIMGADPGVREIILFGSLAEGGPRRLAFDIDLALDGGDPFKALDVTEESAFDVDVVAIHRMPPHVRARIRERGVILAER